jgi:alpha-mannosidase
VSFGTFAEYFAEVEQVAGQLPEVRGELNPIFSGCYTSQSRIKKANHIAEARLGDAEAFGAWASLAAGGPYPTETLAKAWQNTLFNQFHDIIPGSGTIDTREYALGLFQQTMAAAGSQTARAMQAIAGRVDTAALAPVEGQPADSIGEGAGVGFGIENFKVTQSGRGGGLTRVFHVFNASPVARSEVAEFTVWDWAGDLKRLTVKDAEGRIVAHQVLDKGWNNYWGHQYLRLLVQVAAPASGYSTYTLSETDSLSAPRDYPLDPRVEESDELVLENEHLRAELDSASYAVVSLVDKATGEALMERSRPGAIFRYVEEDDRRGMTAWVVGRHMRVRSLAEGARIIKVVRGKLRQSITYETTFGNNSTLTVTLALDAGSRRLDFTADCDWHEIGRRGQGVPQLSFYLPLAYGCPAYNYDVPLGAIVRQPAHMDLPAKSWVHAQRQDGGRSSLQLMTQGSHGFRGADDAVAATLIRSSYDPDPLPEAGMHKIQVAVCLADAQGTNQGLIAAAYGYTHPLSVISGTAHAGELPATGGFMALEAGTAALSAVKLPETGQDGKTLIVRAYETEGKDTTVALRFFRPVLAARLLNVNEREIIDPAGSPRVDGEQITFALGAGRLATVEVRLA